MIGFTTEKTIRLSYLKPSTPSRKAKSLSECFPAYRRRTADVPSARGLTRRTNMNTNPFFTRGRDVRGPLVISRQTSHSSRFYTFLAFLYISRVLIHSSRSCIPLDPKLRVRSFLYGTFCHLPTLLLMLIDTYQTKPGNYAGGSTAAVCQVCLQYADRQQV